MTCINPINFPINQNSYIITLSFYEIQFCYFQRNNVYNNKGGVILVQNILINLLINFCTFFTCNSQQGGCIFFENYDWSNCTFLKSCINQCYASYYSFGYFQTPLNGKITQNFISISGIQNSNYLTINCINSGFLSFESNNISNNFQSFYSSLLSYNIFNYINFCTIINCNSSSQICVGLAGNSNISNCNLIKNNAISYGIVFISNYKLLIFNSIFFENGNTLFVEYHGGNVIVQNCFILHNILNYGKNSITNSEYYNQFIYISTLKLYNWNTFLCDGNFYDFTKIHNFNFNFYCFIFHFLS